MLEKKLNSDGTKAYQRGDDREDRSLIYRNWHRTLKEFIMFDVDTIEWRYRNNELIPVAIIELTRTDSENVGEKYLQAILDRFNIRDKQGEMIRKVADALKVNAYITLFNQQLSKFWVYNLSQNRGWRIFNQKQYIDFLKTR